MRSAGFRLGCVGLLAALVAGCGSPAGRPSGSTAANRVIARETASRVLGEVRLPAGATRLVKKPSGYPSGLTTGGPLEGDTAHVLRDRWWVAPQSPSSVLSYVEAHSPPGSEQSVTGNGSGGYDMVGFTWPKPGNGLEGRMLEISATPLPSGKTAVLEAVQIDWLVTRPVTERVPSGVHAVTVTLTRPGVSMTATRTGPTSRAVITGRAAVATAVRLIDRLSVVQPVMTGCPDLGGPVGSLIVRYGAAPGGPALAEAKLPLYSGWSVNSSGNQCDSIAFSVRGHARKPLIGSSFLPRILALAHLHYAWPTLERNRAAAAADAEMMMSELQLPRGVARSRRRPAGSGMVSAPGPARDDSQSGRSFAGGRCPRASIR